MRRWIATFLCFALCAGAANAGISPERQSELTQTALNSYDQAIEALRNAPDRAEQLLKNAVGAYDQLIAAGVDNAAIEHNLGNAHFRLRQLGEAILHYRRAERFDPGNTAVAANLRYARERVEPFIKPTGESELFDRLLFWNHYTSLQHRFWLATIASLVGWLGMTIWLWRPRPSLMWASLALVGLGLANAGAISWQLWNESARPPAVVVGGSAQLRTGRGEGFEAVLQQPLGAGVEVSILNERGEWVEVRLADGVSGWLPSGAVKRVQS